MDALFGTPQRIMTFDIGNTVAKAAIFEGERQIKTFTLLGANRDELTEMLSAESPEAICCCCVGSDSAGVLDSLRDIAQVPMILLSPDTPVPVEVVYDRSTLGADRLAAAVGVAADGREVMIVDAGTAMTVDIVTDNRFIGGNISPGLSLRFRALNQFTSRLPLVSPHGPLPRFGSDTETAIRAGVVGGLVSEIKADFLAARENHPGLQLILTGGDAPLIAPLLIKEGLSPTIDPEAVGRGLARIFRHNHHASA